MVAKQDTRPWLLVGPWYRWSRPGVPSVGRTSRPALQKYDSPKMVEEFLADPQHSLKFDDDDFVHTVKPLPPLVPALFNGKPRRLSGSKYVKTDIRKLFLDTHKRFYLVVCELHCDAPGFPTATREQVCEAGFVIRRRVPARLNALAIKEVQPILEELQAARSFLGEMEAKSAEEHLNFVKRGLAPQGEAMLDNAVTKSLNRSKATALQKVSAEQLKFDQWTAKFGVALQLQGWQALRDRVGQWTSVEEKPSVITEQTFPLYPLIPDPRDQKHSALGKNIYFGLVPTGSADTDDFGNARFDDVRQYEIRCYVRRHKTECPRTNKKPDCHGEIFWSAPTETYQLAPHFDLIGTSNRPVSMQLPDLEVLQAQAAALPPNKLAPFRMVSPPKSNLEVGADADGNITSHGTSSQICSFSIPLITIVASFVFKLFLPVVVLLFGLFFLLKLKFCIPPSIEISAAVKLELDAKLPSFEADFDISVDAEFDLGGSFGAEMHANLLGVFGPEMTDGLENSPQGIGPAARALMTVEVAESSDETNAPSLTAHLQYEEHVSPEVSA